MHPSGWSILLLLWDSYSKNIWLYASFPFNIYLELSFPATSSLSCLWLNYSSYHRIVSFEFPHPCCTPFILGPLPPSSCTHEDGSGQGFKLWKIAQHTPCMTLPSLPPPLLCHIKEDMGWVWICNMCIQVMTIGYHKFNLSAYVCHIASSRWWINLWEVNLIKILSEVLEIWMVNVYIFEVSGHAECKHWLVSNIIVEWWKNNMLKQVHIGLHYLYFWCIDFGINGEYNMHMRNILMSFT